MGVFKVLLETSRFSYQDQIATQASLAACEEAVRTVLLRAGGRIAPGSGGRISAEFGSVAKVQLFGGVLVAPNHLPIMVHADTQDHGQQRVVRITVAEHFTNRNLFGFEGKFRARCQSLLTQICEDLGGCLGSAHASGANAGGASPSQTTRVDDRPVTPQTPGEPGRGVKMPSERIQRQIEELLTEAENAIRASDWSRVRDRARAVIALDSTNEDAAGYLKAAEANLTETTVDTKPTQWEVCEILWDPSTFISKRIGVHMFWAQATSPTSGRYNAGDSPRFRPTAVYAFAGTELPPNPKDKHATTVFHELVNRLTACDWQPTGRANGGEWWQETFRRPIEESGPAVAPIVVSYSFPITEEGLVALPPNSEVALLTVKDGQCMVVTVKSGKENLRAYIPL